MSFQKTTLKAGDLILFAQGDYSSRQTGPLVKCLKDLEIESLAREFQPNAPRNRWGNPELTPSTFTLWLEQNGWVEELAYNEIETGELGVLGFD